MKLGIIRSAEDPREGTEQRLKRPLTQQERKWLRLGDEALRRPSVRRAAPNRKSNVA